MWVNGALPTGFPCGTLRLRPVTRVECLAKSADGALWSRRLQTGRSNVNKLYRTEDADRYPAPDHHAGFGRDLARHVEIDSQDGLTRAMKSWPRRRCLVAGCSTTAW